MNINKYKQTSNLDSEFAGGCQHIQTVNIKTTNQVQVLLTKQSEQVILPKLPKNTLPLAIHIGWSNVSHYTISQEITNRLTKTHVPIEDLFLFK